MEADELENSLRGSGNGGNGGFNSNMGGPGGNSLPSMYPNQQPQNLGFYVPPPMVWNQMPQQPGQSMMGSAGSPNQGNMADMLNDLMRSKPNFSTDVFGGQVYQSKFKQY